MKLRMVLIVLLACSSALAEDASVMDAFRLRESTPTDLKRQFGEEARRVSTEQEMESWSFQDGQVQGIADYRQGKLDQLLIYLPNDSPELKAMGGIERVMKLSGPTIFINRDPKGISLTLKTAARLRDETGQMMQVMAPPPRESTSLELK
ncbi:MAG: hypothetical protein KDA92_24755, partial [Planctomycetales bacterium]|nr:hypothetical protein [Planctomycetales bacterium]